MDLPCRNSTNREAIQLSIAVGSGKLRDTDLQQICGKRRKVTPIAITIFAGPHKAKRLHVIFYRRHAADVKLICGKIGLKGPSYR